MRKIDPADFIAFRIQIALTPADIFHPDLNELADPDTCGCHDPHCKVVTYFSITEETFFQIFIICLTDDIFQTRCLLKTDHEHSGCGDSEEFNKKVYGEDHAINGTGLIAVDQITLVQHQIVVAGLGIQG